VVHVPLADGADCIEKWRVCAEIIGLCLQGGKTLVACRAGMSRSPAMILYYLLRTGGLKDFDGVLKFVIRKVPEFYPNQSIIDLIKGELCLAVY
jgi:protein-tyrosine phosphatase